MKKIFLISYIIFFSIIYSNAQSLNRQKMDSLFLLIVENNKCMGSISLFQDGKEVYQNSIGFADIDKGLKANANTKYRIGSISKIYTSTLIMMLVEEGKLSLETKLSEFFPEIPNADKITIEHMLRHRSGLFNFTNIENYNSWMEKPQSQKNLIKQFIENGTVFEPDEKMEYSNTNYVLLSYILEKIENKKYPEILKTRILTPCKLENTLYGSQINTENNEALSYQKLADWELASETDMSIPSGAGGIISTPTDINKFLTCLFNEKLVSKNSLNKMKTMVDGYGMALISVPFYEKQAFGHGGGIDGFNSFAAIFPEDNVVFAITSNGLNMSLNDFMIGILSIYFNRDYKLPEFTNPINVDQEILTKYEGLYSNPDLPLKLKIFIEDGILKAQGTGQPSFPLEAFDTNKFRFEQAVLEIEFIPSNQKLILIQQGMRFEMTKEQ